MGFSDRRVPKTPPPPPPGTTAANPFRSSRYCLAELNLRAQKEQQRLYPRTECEASRRLRSLENEHRIDVYQRSKLRARRGLADKANQTKVTCKAVPAAA